MDGDDRFQQEHTNRNYNIFCWKDNQRCWCVMNDRLDRCSRKETINRSKNEFTYTEKWPSDTRHRMPRASLNFGTERIIDESSRHPRIRRSFFWKPFYFSFFSYFLAFSTPCPSHPHHAAFSLSHSNTLFHSLALFHFHTASSHSTSLSVSLPPLYFAWLYFFSLARFSLCSYCVARRSSASLNEFN